MGEKISEIATKAYKEIAKWDRAEIEAAIEVINGYTSTNCGFTSFEISPGLKNLLQSRLSEITPISQQTKTT